MRTSSSQRINTLTSAGLWGDATLCESLRRQARERPAQLAAIDQPNRPEWAAGSAQRLTFEQLNNVSDAMALDFLDRGIGHGDRVMIQLPNVVELMVCYFALSKLGAIVSPLPVQYAAHEISTLSRVFGTQWFIGISNFKGCNLADNGLSAVDSEHIISLTEQVVLRSADGLSSDEMRRLSNYTTANPVDANDIFSVCWTSGTTGTPKGVPRSHNMWFSSGHMTATGSDYNPGDVLLNPFPMVNMSALGGFLFPAMRLGCTIALHHPIDVPVFLNQIQSESINFTIAPPALLNKLAKEPALWKAFSFPSLRGIGSGSAPLSPEMIATFEDDYGVKIYNIYGSNEGIALISSPAAIPDPKQRAGLFPRSGGHDSSWQGETHRSVQSKVIDIDTGDELLHEGARGELCFSGPTVFDGYLGMDADEVFTADGFFRTGDLVEICGSDRQFYRIAGRLKDIINRGGMKISPAEIDTLLEGHESLVEVAVCAYPDADLGEKICACVVVADDKPAPSLGELCSFLAEQGLAKFKLPERIHVVTALPRNPLGKVLRHELSQALPPL